MGRQMTCARTQTRNAPRRRLHVSQSETTACPSRSRPSRIFSSSSHILCGGVNHSTRLLYMQERVHVFGDASGANVLPAGVHELSGIVSPRPSMLQQVPVYPCNISIAAFCAVSYIQQRRSTARLSSSSSRRALRPVALIVFSRPIAALLVLRIYPIFGSMSSYAHLDFTVFAYRQR